MHAIVADQASGLRARVSTQPPLHLPVLYADFLLFKGVQVQLPPSVLVWHWRARAAPAVGWDLQTRLHVVGSPPQIDLESLQRWRTLFPQWHLVGRRLELLHIVDVACLWLRTGTELMPRLTALLGWLSKSRPEMPIIFAGIGSGAAQRLQQWVHSRYPLECLNDMDANRLRSLPTDGYARLIRWATASQSVNLVSEL